MIIPQIQKCKTNNNSQFKMIKLKINKILINIYKPHRYILKVDQKNYLNQMIAFYILVKYFKHKKYYKVTPCSLLIKIRTLFPISVICSVSHQTLVKRENKAYRKCYNHNNNTHHKKNINKSNNNNHNPNRNSKGQRNKKTQKRVVVHKRKWKKAPILKIKKK